MKSQRMINWGFLFLFILMVIWIGIHGREEANGIDEPTGINSIKDDFMKTVFHRHGYQEELLGELENENGVRLYSDAAGNLYFVYGSTSVPDASYRIEKHSWVKKP